MFLSQKTKRKIHKKETVDYLDKLEEVKKQN